MDDEENEKNDCKTDERNRKGNCKHLVWCNLMYKKFFSFPGKDSYKLLIMSRVSCSDEFFIIRLIKKRKKERKKERRKSLISFIGYVYAIMNYFLFFFVIHVATWYARYQNYRQHKGDTMEMKSKLYLRIILLIYYMME